MHKNKGHPLSMNDFEVTLMCDLTFPLISTYQLFWFSDKITNFLRKNTFFKSSEGIIIGAIDDFTYERTKMEGVENVYLLGFGSNTSANSFKALKVLFFSEEEKLATHKKIISSIHELIDCVHDDKDGSSYISWAI